MKLIDISRTIGNGAIVMPSDEPLRHEPLATISEDCPYRMTKLGGWSTHVLTHMDAPAHFVKDGLTLDQIPLSRFMGEAVVIEVKGDAVKASDVPPASESAGKALFFKTRNSGFPSEGPFRTDYTCLLPEAAQACVERRVTMVGIDYASVDPADTKDFPSHQILLKAGVLILENLLLKDVRPGLYRFSALPLKIKDADGAPVRAVLVR